jgi:hypothetical protein
MDIGAAVVVPDLLCPGVFSGGLVIEEDDIGLYPLLVKYKVYPVV